MMFVNDLLQKKKVFHCNRSNFNGRSQLKKISHSINENLHLRVVSYPRFHCIALYPLTIQRQPNFNQSWLDHVKFPALQAVLALSPCWLILSSVTSDNCNFKSKCTLGSTNLNYSRCHQLVGQQRLQPVEWANVLLSYWWNPLWHSQSTSTPWLFIRFHSEGKLFSIFLVILGALCSHKAALALKILPSRA